MAHPSGLSRHKHFSEFTEPLFTAEGTKTPSTRKALAQKNLGMVVANSSAAVYRGMPAPATATGTATLSAADITNGLLLGTPAAAANYTLPTCAALDAVLTDFEVGDAFEFRIVNLAVTAANDITVLTNTGWTLSGHMVVEANEATQVNASQGTFIARKTGTATYTLYRVA